MRKLTKPDESADKIFKTCISRVRNRNLKNRLELCTDEIVQVTAEFEAKVVQSKLHTIPTSDNVANTVTSGEMKKVYTDRMVQKASPGRPYYDKIMALPNHGRCPLCGQRIVSTIDHHLPKAHFPALVVSPSNLIPACKDCNKTKKDDIPENSETETLHPYYDDVEDEVWLKARLIEGEPVSVFYYVDPPSIWDTTLAARVNNHFKVFGLAELYASYAAEDISNIYHLSITLFNSAGGQTVKEFLSTMAESHKTKIINSWQTALYTCLSDSTWYCNQYLSGNS